jgi:hypothetical protein
VPIFIDRGAPPRAYRRLAQARGRSGRQAQAALRRNREQRADLADRLLKDRIAELKATRDQALTDAERVEGALDRLGPAIAPAALKTFATQTRKRMRTESGGDRGDHLRALAQRIEVDAKKIRIMGRKSVLLRTLVAASSASRRAHESR